MWSLHNHFIRLDNTPNMWCKLDFLCQVLVYNGTFYPYDSSLPSAYYPDTLLQTNFMIRYYLSYCFPHASHMQAFNNTLTEQYTLFLVLCNIQVRVLQPVHLFVSKLCVYCYDLSLVIAVQDTTMWMFPTGKNFRWRN